MTAAFAAAGMIRPGNGVIMVGDVETMSRPAIGLTAATAERFRSLFAKDPTQAVAEFSTLKAADFLPAKGWTNRITDCIMGAHMQETTKEWEITRESQDDWAYQSHIRAAAAWNSGAQR